MRDAFIAAGHDAISCDLLPTAPARTPRRRAGTAAGPVGFGHRTSAVQLPLSGHLAIPWNPERLPAELVAETFCNLATCFLGLLEANAPRNGR